MADREALRGRMRDAQHAARGFHAGGASAVPMKRRYVTTDVFTDQRFGGNPLAVVLDAEGLSTRQMQALALEFNYSESTFVLPPDDPGHTARVRIFTPRTEVPFAGHPNVGTAFVLARDHRYHRDAAAGGFRFEEAAGIVPLTLLKERGTVVGAELLAPELLSRRSIVSREVAARCLSLEVGDIATGGHAPQIASVGLPFLIVEIASRAALSRSRPSLSAYSEILPRDGADAIFAYVRENGSDADETRLSARMFSPFDGIIEDPATGSATAATVALLAELKGGSGEHRWRVEQGVDMGRPSLLLATTTTLAGKTTATRVGGHCVAVMEGSFTLEGEESV